MGLDLRDIVTQDRALRVLEKGNKGRLAYVPTGAWYRLQIWVEAVRGETPGPLFTRIRRFGDVTLNRLTDQAVYHILQVSQSHAGIGKCSPHDLRRTFATAMLDNEEDLITVKDAMGHASVTTTQQYDRRGEQRLQDARDRLGLSKHKQGCCTPPYFYINTIFDRLSQSSIDVCNNSDGEWVVPPQQAVWIPPPATMHAVRFGNVITRSLYIEPECVAALVKHRRREVISVSPLLSQLLLEAVDLPPLYDSARERVLIHLMLLELAAMPVRAFDIPLP